MLLEPTWLLFTGFLSNTSFYILFICALNVCYVVNFGLLYGSRYTKQLDVQLCRRQLLANSIQLPTINARKRAQKRSSVPSPTSWLFICEITLDFDQFTSTMSYLSFVLLEEIQKSIVLVKVHVFYDEFTKKYLNIVQAFDLISR